MIVRLTCAIIIPLLPELDFLSCREIGCEREKFDITMQTSGFKINISAAYKTQTKVLQGV